MNEKRKLISILVVISVLLFSSGMYFERTFTEPTERIVYIIEEKESLSIMTYTASGYVNETSWNLAWTGNSLTPHILQPVWTNDSYVVLIQYGNSHTRDINVTIHIEYGGEQFSDLYEYLGSRVFGYKPDGHHVEIVRYDNLRQSVTMVNLVTIILLMRGQPISDNMLMSSVLNVTFST